MATERKFEVVGETDDAPEPSSSQVFAASAITLANALKAAYNTHLSESNVHFNNDGTNTVAAANAFR